MDKKEDNSKFGLNNEFQQRIPGFGDVIVVDTDHYDSEQDGATVQLSIEDATRRIDAGELKQKLEQEDSVREDLEQEQTVMESETDTKNQAEGLEADEEEFDYLDESADIVDVDEEVADDQKLDVNKKKRRKVRLIRVASVFLTLVIMYLTFVFSEIPVVAKWRTIYIETAMSTNSHQWLATMFIPKSVIDKVMAQKKKDIDKQKGLASSWDNAPDAAEEAKKEFFEEYWELDSPSVQSYLKNRPALTKNGYDKLLIEDLEGKQNLKTTKGDSVLVVDVENNLLIIGVKGESYQGKMAIVKNSSQVDLVKSRSLGSSGELIASFVEREDAVVGVNCSGFKDVHGVGSGGQVMGSLIIDGEQYGYPKGGFWKFFGMKEDNLFYITDSYLADVTEYRWGAEFFPALVIDGENVVDGTFGMGIQPRTTIGQSKDGDFMMLVVDGRQVGYSLGCTVAECADIMGRYNVYQATNVDGGSSSVMIYKGQQITKSSSVMGNGRYSPDALIVRKAKDVPEEDESVTVIKAQGGTSQSSDTQKKNSSDHR